MPARRDAAERFWEKVHKTATCWEWTAQLSAGRYGGFSVLHKEVKAHRFSWELHNGPIPDGMHVCHHCDNTICVRPDHLFLGTHRDNMADRDAKGRQAKMVGERNPRARLSAAQVEAIRAARAAGESCTALGEQYGVTKTQISFIARYLSWKAVA